MRQGRRKLAVFDGHDLPVRSPGLCAPQRDGGRHPGRHSLTYRGSQAAASTGTQEQQRRTASATGTPGGKRSHRVAGGPDQGAVRDGAVPHEDRVEGRPRVDDVQDRARVRRGNLLRAIGAHIVAGSIHPAAPCVEEDVAEFALVRRLRAGGRVRQPGGPSHSTTSGGRAIPGSQRLQREARRPQSWTLRRAVSRRLVASPLAAAPPMRTPVNDPGPGPTTTRASSPTPIPASAKHLARPPESVPTRARTGS